MSIIKFTNGSMIAGYDGQGTVRSNRGNIILKLDDDGFWHKINTKTGSDEILDIQTIDRQEV